MSGLKTMEHIVDTPIHDLYKNPKNSYRVQHRVQNSPTLENVLEWFVAQQTISLCDKPSFVVRKTH